MTKILKFSDLPDGFGEVTGEVEEATLPEGACPQLHADYTEYEEHEETQHEHIAEHGQRVQQQHHKYAHACEKVTFFISNTHIILENTEREKVLVTCRSYTIKALVKITIKPACILLPELFSV